MKILILADAFPPDYCDGAGIAAYRIAMALLESGNELFVITTTREKQKEGISEYKGLKIYNIYSNYNLKLRSYVSLWNYFVVKKIDTLIREIKPEVVHAHNIHTYLSYKSLETAKKYCNAVLVTLHDLMAVHYGKFKNFYEKDCLSANCKYKYKISLTQKLSMAGKQYNLFRNMIIKHYLKFADKIFSISNEQKKVLETNGIKNIETVYNGINLDNWSAGDEAVKNFKEKYLLTENKIVFFAVNRLSVDKGSHVIIESFKKVKDGVPSAKLLIAGNVNHATKDMQNIASNFAVADSICFTGLLSEESMKAAYASSDVCVTPSIYFDPFNLSNIEAMAAKKPVVGTCFGGTPEIIKDGTTGFIVNPFNVDMMSDKIVTLLNNSELAKNMGVNGANRVKNLFNIRIISEQYYQYYKIFRKSK